MRTPVRPAPYEAERWLLRARRLRRLDFVATAVALWPVAALALDTTAVPAAVAALTVTGVGALAPGLRLRWRPVSALASLSVSRGLRPGDRAWLVLPDRVEGVIVTARRGQRLVVAHPDQGPAEGVEVRRTRVVVAPLD